MDIKSCSEFSGQGWLEGELALTEETRNEYLERVGAHIYEDFKQGLWTYEEAEASLETLDRCCDGTEWLGMPFIPEDIL